MCIFIHSSYSCQYHIYVAIFMDVWTLHRSVILLIVGKAAAQDNGLSE